MALTHHADHNRRVVANRLAPASLAAFVAAMKEARQEALAEGGGGAAGADATKAAVKLPDWVDLAYRFPVALWDDAIESLGREVAAGA